MHFLGFYFVAISYGLNLCVCVRGMKLPFIKRSRTLKKRLWFHGGSTNQSEL